MPLQIRRGTQAERGAMTVPLAQGELLYVTDDQRLYIGNGLTPGGVQITGYTNEDAVDAVAAAFLAGVHNGISFTYGSTQDANNRIDASINLSNYSGIIRADAFKGSVFADDGSTIGGTILVDAVDGVLRGDHIGNVTGNVTGNLTGNVTGNVSGNVTGNLSGNVTGNLTGNTLGYHTGDVKGSVFGDNSSILVDSVSSLIRGKYDNGDISIDSNSILSDAAPLGAFENSPVYIGSASSPATVQMYSNSVSKNFITLVGVGDNLTASGVVFKTSRGTLSSPTTVLAGDNIAGFQGDAYDGTDYRTVGRFGLLADPNGTISGGFVPGAFAALTIDSTGNAKILTFDSEGVLNAPVIKATGYATGSLPLSPDEGWIVFDSTTKQFKGWNGTSWAVLG